MYVGVCRAESCVIRVFGDSAGETRQWIAARRARYRPVLLTIFSRPLLTIFDGPLLTIFSGPLLHSRHSPRRRRTVGVRYVSPLLTLLIQQHINIRGDVFALDKSPSALRNVRRVFQFGSCELFVESLYLAVRVCLVVLRSACIIVLGVGALLPHSLHEQ